MRPHREVRQRRKLFNIHFRNIRGGPARPGGLADEGDVDMHKVARVLHEVAYPSC